MIQNKARILVVDDDSNLRKTLMDILQLKGYETIGAATGAEAVTALEGGPINLALIDLMLPDMPGLEVMERLKNVMPLTEAIILTGHASMDTAIAATRKGAFSYLVKPYQMDDLLLNIRHGIERQKSQEEIIRLASYPRLNPNPVIETDFNGEVTYANPAAERLFPDLASLARSHPLLLDFETTLAAFRQGGKQEVVREICHDGNIYEQHISHVPESGLVRFYVLDITDRKKAENEILHLATTDSLTGVANRRQGLKELVQEMERARRYSTPLSLIMFDIDHFKRVNDTFGHGVGDDVLRAVTSLVRENIRAAEIQARWGGEEFVVVLPQTGLAGAAVAAEKLRQVIAAHRFEQVGTVTVSFGVTEFEPADALDILLKRVDNALYRAKGNGRNRVETLTGKPSRDHAPVEERPKSYPGIPAA